MRLSHGFARDVLERVIGGPLPGVEEVAARAQWRWLDPGQVLIEAGAPSRWLIIVETGLLVESVQKAAQVITVGFLEKGQVGGNFSLMQPTPSSGVRRSIRRALTSSHRPTVIPRRSPPVPFSLTQNRSDASPLVTGRGPVSYTHLTLPTSDLV